MVAEPDSVNPTADEPDPGPPGPETAERDLGNDLVARHTPGPNGPGAAGRAAAAQAEEIAARPQRTPPRPQSWGRGQGWELARAAQRLLAEGQRLADRLKVQTLLLSQVWAAAPGAAEPRRQAVQRVFAGWQQEILGRFQEETVGRHPLVASHQQGDVSGPLRTHLAEMRRRAGRAQVLFALGPSSGEEVPHPALGGPLWDPAAHQAAAQEALGAIRAVAAPASPQAERDEAQRVQDLSGRRRTLLDSLQQRAWRHPEQLLTFSQTATTQLTGAFDLTRQQFTSAVEHDAAAEGLPVQFVRDVSRRVGEAAQLPRKPQAPATETPTGQPTAVSEAVREALRPVVARPTEVLAQAGESSEARPQPPVPLVALPAVQGPLGPGEGAARRGGIGELRPHPPVPLVALPAVQGPPGPGEAAARVGRISEAQPRVTIPLAVSAAVPEALRPTGDSTAGRHPLVASPPFALDRESGVIRFGEGRQDQPLPTSQENVRATYRQGTGPGGGVPAGPLGLLITRPLGLQGATNRPVPTGALAGVGEMRPPDPAAVLAQTARTIRTIREVQPPDPAAVLAQTARTIREVRPPLPGLFPPPPSGILGGLRPPLPGPGGMPKLLRVGLLSGEPIPSRFKPPEEGFPPQPTGPIPGGMKPPLEVFPPSPPWVKLPGWEVLMPEGPLPGGVKPPEEGFPPKPPGPLPGRMKPPLVGLLPEPPLVGLLPEGPLPGGVKLPSLEVLMPEGTVPGGVVPPPEGGTQEPAGGLGPAIVEKAYAVGPSGMAAPSSLPTRSPVIESVLPKGSTPTTLPTPRRPAGLRRMAGPGTLLGAAARGRMKGISSPEGGGLGRPRSVPWAAGMTTFGKPARSRGLHVLSSLPGDPVVHELTRALQQPPAPWVPATPSLPLGGGEGGRGHWATGPLGHWATGPLGNQPQPPEPNFLISPLPSATLGTLGTIQRRPLVSGLAAAQRGLLPGIGAGIPLAVGAVHFTALGSQVPASAARIFALAEMMARAECSRILATSPEVAAALGPADVDLAAVTVPVTVATAGRTDEQIAQDLGQRLAQGIVNAARQAAPTTRSSLTDLAWEFFQRKPTNGTEPGWAESQARAVERTVREAGSAPRNLAEPDAGPSEGEARAVQARLMSGAPTAGPRAQRAPAGSVQRSWLSDVGGWVSDKWKGATEAVGGAVSYVAEKAVDVAMIIPKAATKVVTTTMTVAGKGLELAGFENAGQGLQSAAVVVDQKVQGAIDFIKLAAKVLANINLGVIQGLIEFLWDLTIGTAWDVFKAAYNLTGWALYKVLPAGWCDPYKEQHDDTVEFFSALGKLFGNPGQTWDAMWVGAKAEVDAQPDVDQKARVIAKMIVKVVANVILFYKGLVQAGKAAGKAAAAAGKAIVQGGKQLGKAASKGIVQVGKGVAQAGRTVRQQGLRQAIRTATQAAGRGLSAAGEAVGTGARATGRAIRRGTGAVRQVGSKAAEGLQKARQAVKSGAVTKALTGAGSRALDATGRATRTLIQGVGFVIQHPIQAVQRLWAQRGALWEAFRRVGGKYLRWVDEEVEIGWWKQHGKWWKQQYNTVRNRLKGIDQATEGLDDVARRAEELMKQAGHSADEIEDLHRFSRRVDEATDQIEDVKHALDDLDEAPEVAARQQQVLSRVQDTNDALHQLLRQGHVKELTLEKLRALGRLPDDDPILQAVRQYGDWKKMAEALAASPDLQKGFHQWRQAIADYMTQHFGVQPTGTIQGMLNDFDFSLPMGQASKWSEVDAWFKSMGLSNWEKALHSTGFISPKPLHIYDQMMSPTQRRLFEPMREELMKQGQGLVLGHMKHQAEEVAQKAALLRQQGKVEEALKLAQQAQDMEAEVRRFARSIGIDPSTIEVPRLPRTQAARDALRQSLLEAIDNNLKAFNAHPTAENARRVIEAQMKFNSLFYKHDYFLPGAVKRTVSLKEGMVSVPLENVKVNPDVLRQLHREALAKGANFAEEARQWQRFLQQAEAGQLNELPLKYLRQVEAKAKQMGRVDDAASLRRVVDRGEFMSLQEQLESVTGNKYLFEHMVASCDGDLFTAAMRYETAKYADRVFEAADDLKRFYGIDIEKKWPALKSYREKVRKIYKDHQAVWGRLEPGEFKGVFKPSADFTDYLAVQEMLDVARRTGNQPAIDYFKGVLAQMQAHPHLIMSKAQQAEIAQYMRELRDAQNTIAQMLRDRLTQAQREAAAWRGAVTTKLGAQAVPKEQAEE